MMTISAKEYDGDYADAELSEEDDKPAKDEDLKGKKGDEYRFGGGSRRKERGRRMRERWVDKEWQMRRCYNKAAAAAETSTDQCRLMVRSKGPDSVCICMDMMEVKACRDLGLDLPSDWTVEIPGIAVDVVESSSGSNSPIANWRISSPGDDPKEVKARLKVWAQAVALASASHLNSPATN